MSNPRDKNQQDRPGTLTAYDRRQLGKARARLLEARFQIELALSDGNYHAAETPLRCAFASKFAAEAARLATQADRRITRRARQGSA